MLDDASLAAVLGAIGPFVRDERKRKLPGEGGQKQLEKLSNVDQPTISRIEQGKVPELLTIGKVARGLGYDSLSAFFLQLERHERALSDTETDEAAIKRLKPSEQVATNPPQHSSSSKGGDRGEPGALSAAFHDDSPDALRDLASAFITVGSRLEYLARQREATSPPQPIRGPRRQKSGRRKRST